MPSIITGPININEAGGTLVFGDTFYIAPKESSKSASGSGSFNTGNVIVTNNGVSSTNPLDPDTVDQATTGNA
ncbi:spore germination protein [Bacillaceae bacterium S4-13-58]